MRHLRAVVRIAMILLITGALYTVWIVGRVFVPGMPRRLAWRDRLVSIWANRVIRIIGLSVSQTGTPPDPPFLLVCNHLSYVDILVMLARTNGTLIAKADVRDWPLIGFLAKEVGTIFLDRQSSRDVVRVGALMEDCLKRGEGVTFFPEATSTRGIDVWKFRSSLFDYPARTGLPVHYATITYSTRPEDEPASEIVCWWGDMTFGDHLYNLLTLSRFSSFIHFGAVPISDPDRKELAARVHQAVTSNFKPVLQKQEI